MNISFYFVSGCFKIELEVGRCEQFLPRGRTKHFYTASKSKKIPAIYQFHYVCEMVISRIVQCG